MSSEEWGGASDDSRAEKFILLRITSRTKLIHSIKHRKHGDPLELMKVFKGFNNINAEEYFKVDQSNITRKLTTFNNRLKNPTKRRQILFSSILPGILYSPMSLTV